MKNIKLVLIALMLTIGGLATAPAANITVKVCTGENPNKCPVPAQSYFGCGTSEDAAATRICTITRNGKKEVLPYQVIPLGTKSGGRCGYHWFNVICIN